MSGRANVRHSEFYGGHALASRRRVALGVWAHVRPSSYHWHTTTAAMAFCADSPSLASRALVGRYRVAWSDVGRVNESAAARLSRDRAPPRAMQTSTCSGHTLPTSTPEADLGMFSMFGRTGAPTKRGRHNRTGKFLKHGNMPEIIEIIIRKQFCVAGWRHKVSSRVASW